MARPLEHDHRLDLRALPQGFVHVLLVLFYFNNTATTEIYTLSLHDALPIFACGMRVRTRGVSVARPSARASSAVSTRRTASGIVRTCRTSYSVRYRVIAFAFASRVPTHELAVDPLRCALTTGAIATRDSAAIADTLYSPTGHEARDADRCLSVQPGPTPVEDHSAPHGFAADRLRRAMLGYRTPMPTRTAQACRLRKSRRKRSSRTCRCSRSSRPTRSSALPPARSSCTYLAGRSCSTGAIRASASISCCTAR